MSSQLSAPSSQLASNSARGGRNRVALPNQVGDEFAALVRVCEALGSAAELAIQRGLEQVVLGRLAKELGDHFLREIAVDAHGEQAPHHSAWAASSSAHLRPRNGHGGT